MAGFKIGDWELKQEDFDKVVDLKWPQALLQVVARLGSCFFVVSPVATTRKFIPTPEGTEICRIIEASFGATGQELDTRADTLAQAVKAAYDRYVDVQESLLAAGDVNLAKPFP